MAKATINVEGVGTKASGFATADLGPFRCGSCAWFDWGKKGKASHCEHPEVKADPEMKDRTTDGDPIVDQNACCNYFRPYKKLLDIPLESVGL